MEYFHCTYDEIMSLKDFNPESGVSNVESKLKFINIDGKNYLIKIYMSDVEDYNSQSVIKNIETFINYRDFFESFIPSLVLPKHALMVEYEKYFTNYHHIAHTMDYIESVSLRGLLYSDVVTYSDKINYLKSVGSIMNSFRNVKEFEIYIGDMHEGNFIVDKYGNLRIVDAPSCHIVGNGVNFSKYLYENDGILDFKLRAKYKKNEHDIIYPNNDTDIFCYYFMILNTLARKELHRLSQEEFYDYLYYLSSIGVSKEFLFNVEGLFSLKENVNPLYLLDSFNERIFEEANVNVYSKKTGNFI